MFSLDEKQSEKLNKWLEEIETQRTKTKGEKPYYGAIGGSLTYCFTPTSIGLVTEVIYCEGMLCEAKIDLTDYKDW